MTSEQFEISMLAQLAWSEGKEYGYQMMEAVACVARARKRAGWGTWLDILKNWQVYSGREFQPELSPCFADACDPNVRKLFRVIDDIYRGIAPNVYAVSPDGKEALYYADLSKCDREWFVDNIARKPEAHPRVSNINGSVVFFA